MYWKHYQEAGEEALLHGNIDDAKRHFQCALKEAESSTENSREAAISSLSLAEIDIFEGNLARAESRLLGTVASFSENTDMLLASALTRLGHVYVFRDEYARAKPLLEQALGLRRDLQQEDDGEQLSVQSNLARCYQHEGRIVEAEAMLRQVLQKREKVLGQGHPGLVEDIANLAKCLSKRGSHTDAEALHFRALDLLDANRTADPRCVPIVEGLIESYMSYGKTQAAYDLCARMLEKWKELGKKEGAAIILIERHTARLNALMRSPRTSAEKAPHDDWNFDLQLALENASSDVNYLSWLEETAANLDRLKQHDKAKALYEKAKSIVERVYGAEHLRTAQVLRGLGENATWRGDEESATRFLKLAASIDKSPPSPAKAAPQPVPTIPLTPAEKADYHDLMARVMAEHGLIEPAVQYESHADALREQEDREE